MISVTEMTDKEFLTIRDFIKKSCGINLSEEKKSLVHSRLRPILEQKGFRDFTQYYNYLTSDMSGEALTVFFDKITTNHTFFMREPDHFYYFRDNVLPYIEENHNREKDLRVWCAGCSSGEEAYALEIIIHDYFKNKPGWNKEILATDISSAALAKAVMGVYRNESLSTLPVSWKSDYFIPHDEKQSSVKNELKNDVVLRKFNLMDKFPSFKRPFQTIFCRNVMIYFDNATRTELVKKFYDVMEPGAYFFIGHSESLSHAETDFKYVMPAIYRK